MSVKELIERNLIWQIEKGLFGRKCPSCNEIITHKGENYRRASDSCRRSHLERCICFSCRGKNQKGKELKPAPEGVWKNDLGNWCRKCPTCQEIIVSIGVGEKSLKSQVVQRHNNKMLCRKCSQKNKKLPETVHLTGSSSYNTFAYWTKEEEEIINQNGMNLTVSDLVKLIPRHTEASLRNKRNRLGIKISKELRSQIGKDGRAKRSPESLFFTDQSMRLDTLTNEEYQMLVGSLLGDGCIKYAGAVKNPIFYEGHGEKQSEYLKWKVTFFERFNPIFTERRRPSEPDKLRPEMITNSHPIFQQLRDMVYGENEKGAVEKRYPHPDLISKLDEFGLLIWYLDDGYAGGKWCRRKLANGEIRKYLLKEVWPSLAVKSMDIPTLNQAVEILNKNLGLNLKILENKWKDSTNRIIRFDVSSRDKILPIWKELAMKYSLPKSMWYKLER